MQAYAAEFLGTAILVLLGNGVVANAVLARTKGHDGGWIVIAMGWGMAVFVAVLCIAEISGAHINPAVTVGLAAAGEFSWERVPGFCAAQFLGAFLGAILVWLFYGDHYASTDDADAKLATFCTAPNIDRPLRNFFCEVIGTAVLVLAVLLAEDATIRLPGVLDPNASPAHVGLGAVGAIPVALVVLAIGLSLGGTTGYAINPARDLSPRIAHALLPIPGKRDSQWGYAWIPVAGPLAGALLAVGIASALGG